jgi:hypothetical protein
MPGPPRGRIARACEGEAVTEDDQPGLLTGAAITDDHPALRTAVCILTAGFLSPWPEPMPSCEMVIRWSEL